MDQEFQRTKRLAQVVEAVAKAAQDPRIHRYAEWRGMKPPLKDGAGRQQGRLAP